MKLVVLKKPKLIYHAAHINQARNYIKALKVGAFIMSVRVVRNMLRGVLVSVNIWLEHLLLEINFRKDNSQKGQANWVLYIAVLSNTKNE